MSVLARGIRPAEDEMAEIPKWWMKGDWFHDANQARVEARPLAKAIPRFLQERQEVTS